MIIVAMIKFYSFEDKGYGWPNNLQWVSGITFWMSKNGSMV